MADLSEENDVLRWKTETVVPSVASDVTIPDQRGTDVSSEHHDEFLPENDGRKSDFSVNNRELLSAVREVHQKQMRMEQMTRYIEELYDQRNGLITQVQGLHRAVTERDAHITAYAGAVRDRDTALQHMKKLYESLRRQQEKLALKIRTSEESATSADEDLNDAELSFRAMKSFTVVNGHQELYDEELEDLSNKIYVKEHILTRQMTSTWENLVRWLQGKGILHETKHL